MSIRQGQSPEPPQDLWTALDDWQPSPVSADFDCGLRRKIRKVDERRVWIWRLVPVAPVLLAFTFVLVTSMPHRHKSELQPSLAVPNMTTQGRDVAQALDDVEMLRQIGPPKFVSKSL